MSTRQDELAAAFETVETVDRWFASNCQSYRIHWAPREAVFRGETGDSRGSVPAAFQDFFRSKGVPWLVETIDGREILTARVRLTPPRRRTALHVALFLLTFVTTLCCEGLAGSPEELFGRIWWGAMELHAWVLGRPLPDWPLFLGFVTRSLYFCIPLLTILTAHEFGHYFAARRHRMSVSLPYYVPAPFGIGTFGAVIALHSPMTHRRAVFDVGVAGPLAGFVVALPILYYGLTLSAVEPVSRFTHVAYLEEGKSLLYAGAIWAVKGPIPMGYTVDLHLMAWAGWIGLFITSLNLIPVGQLDGGHVTYALFGRAHFALAVGTFAALVAMSAVLMTYGWPGYLVFAAILLFLVRLHHPPAMDERLGLDRWRIWVGGLVLLLLVLTFVPVPLRIVVP